MSKFLCGIGEMIMSNIEFSTVEENCLQLNDSNIFIINEDNKCQVISKCEDDCINQISIFDNIVDAMDFASMLYCEDTKKH